MTRAVNDPAEPGFDAWGLPPTQALALEVIAARTRLGEHVAAGDSGTATVAVTMREGRPVGRIAHVHKECQFRQVAGGLAHHEGRCYCHGGDGEGTPGMTLREEAVEVWRRMQAGELYGRHGG